MATAEFAAVRDALRRRLMFRDVLYRGEIERVAREQADRLLGPEVATFVEQAR